MKIVVLIFFLTILFSKIYPQEGKFIYQFHSKEIKAGKFTFNAPDTSLNFEAMAKAGYMVASNNPYFQATKNLGPIPNGTWLIYAIKNDRIYTLRLKPDKDVAILYRDGFLIHGTGKDETPEQSSIGCIILEKKYRKKLYDAFKKYGEIRIKVTNIVTGDEMKKS